MDKLIKLSESAKFSKSITMQKQFPNIHISSLSSQIYLIAAIGFQNPERFQISPLQHYLENDQSTEQLIFSSLALQMECLYVLISISTFST